jgi:hypothetical protein
MTLTEFTLYYVYMDREGLCDRYHFRSEHLHDVPSQIWGITPASLTSASAALPPPTQRAWSPGSALPYGRVWPNPTGLLSVSSCMPKADLATVAAHEPS